LISDSLHARLAVVASAPVLLVASDYDGTLSPIVDDPAAAVPDEDALATLARIGGLRNTHAVVISGRSLETLRRLTGDPDDLRLIGAHGADDPERSIDRALSVPVARLEERLRELAYQHPGARVEPKVVGAAFHYRNVLHKSEAADRAREIAVEEGARVIEGKMVVESVFGDVDKGTVVADLRIRVGAGAVAFVGDDVTDEHVFAVLGPEDVGVKVGQGSTLARFCVDRQTDVGPLLRSLELARGNAAGVRTDSQA
jgi:trehalose 6-phosphate phosphatase